MAAWRERAPHSPWVTPAAESGAMGATQPKNRSAASRTCEGRLASAPQRVTISRASLRDTSLDACDCGATLRPGVGFGNEDEAPGFPGTMRFEFMRLPPGARATPRS